MKGLGRTTRRLILGAVITFTLTVLGFVLAIWTEDPRWGQNACLSLACTAVFVILAVNAHASDLYSEWKSER